MFSKLTVGSNFTYMVISTVITLLNMAFTLVKIELESKALHETRFEYILRSLKARQGWIPFIHLVQGGTLDFDIAFGRIRCSYPLLTDLLGIYLNFKFNMTDQLLMKL